MFSPVFTGSLLLPWAADRKAEKRQDLGHSKSNIPAWIWLWWAQVLMSRKGSTFRKHQEPTTGLKTGGCVPAGLGQSPPSFLPLPPIQFTPAGGLEDSGADRQPSSPGQRGGVGGPAWPHQRHPASPRLLTKAPRALLSPAPTWNCQAHVPRPPQLQPGSKGTSSVKPFMTPRAC